MAVYVSNQRNRTDPGELLGRVRDVVLAVVALAILAVPMLVTAAAIRVTSPGPALFRQERVGRRHKVFTFYKFRSMQLDGDDSAHRDLIARELRGEITTVAGSCKLSGDPRVTPIGRWLRATSLDELPQLLNVLRGHMSLVGHRPCLPWEADMFPPEYEARFSVRPGMTGLWQIRGRSRVGTLDMLRLDVTYVEQRSQRLDFLILLLTLPALLHGGAR